MSARRLLEPSAIRERCARILDAGLRGELAHFTLEMEKLEAIVDRVVDVARRSFPSPAAIPHHSRWDHFRAGRVDRVADFDRHIARFDEDEKARARFDLVVTSALLDASAGRRWSHKEREGDRQQARSEGLAVASYHLFLQGGFSSDPKRPLRADAVGLRSFDRAILAEGMRRGAPLGLMRRLGDALGAEPALFGRDEPRIGGLYDHLTKEAQGGTLPAPRVLAAVLRGFSPIWPGHIEREGLNLGDVWPHPAAGGEGVTEGLVPFHQLGQWLTYSLLDPLERAGLTVTNLGALTGLAEPRNGGLFVDMGAIVPRRAEILGRTWAPGDEVVVEWRALTVALLDRIAPEVRRRLGLDEEELCMSKVVECTARAGREIALDERADAAPPIRVTQDGTIF